MIIIYREQILHSVGLQACCSSLYENSKSLCFPFFCSVFAYFRRNMTIVRSHSSLTPPGRCDRYLKEVSTVSADGSQVVVVMGRVSVSSAQSSAWGHPVLHPLVIIMLPGFVTFFINNSGVTWLKSVKDVLFLPTIRSFQCGTGCMWWLYPVVMDG